MKSEIEVDYRVDMEQQLEKFSWVHTDENMNVPLKQDDPNMQFYHSYSGITCSEGSSFKSYSGLFGKSSNIKTPKIETSSIPGTSADPSQLFKNLSSLNDPKLHQLAEWNLLGNPTYYYVSQILEASYYRPQFGRNLASSETLTFFCFHG